MKAFLFRIAAFLICVAGLLCIVNSGLDWALSKKAYPQAVAIENSNDKLKGLYLIDNAPKDNVMILGSSELNMWTIPTHPGNFFKDKDVDFTLNLIGRGSCQAIVHASILASGKNLENKPVIFIISPQSFVEEGIAPDMFFANFSELQQLTYLLDSKLSMDIKEGFSHRFIELKANYEENQGELANLESASLAASFTKDKSVKGKIMFAIFSPFFQVRRLLLEIKDKYDSLKIITSALPDEMLEKSEIDWEKERAAQIPIAQNETTNNDYGFLNDYYNVNIGRKLMTFEGKDSNLSLDTSIEYEDLSLLLDICRERNIKPIMIHQPLNGKWSDYTGFTKDRRDTYYENVLALLKEKDVQVWDLSGYEYEPYFMCDAIHLGWLGWLNINEEIGKLDYNNY